MSPRVSVVVPVYNPGPALADCVASLLGQSLPAEEVEIILVDDGSTDDTPARLDELAAVHPNVQSIHIPPSGAPGKPRNVGLEAARGEYVHFVDADDVLAPRALEWLTAMADRNESDVVIGKYASATLERSQGIFTHNRDRASLAETPELMTTSWAPGKLFRVAMLRQAGITFPEGWRWMEDQLFVLRAYFAARNISVFADAPCYYFVRREEGGHLSAEPIEPGARVQHLAEVFDVIEAEAPDGPLRDRLIRRFYRANILSTFDERYLAGNADARARIFERFAAFAAQRVPRPIDDTYGGAQRVRARLLRAGNADDMLAFTRRLEDLVVHVTTRRLRWRRGRLLVDVTGELRHASDGSPLTVVVGDGSATLDPAFTGEVGEPVDADIEGIRARIGLKEAGSAVEWILPGSTQVALRDAGPCPGGARRRRAIATISVEIDPAHVGPAGRGLANGRWSVQVRWRSLSVNRVGAVPAPAAAGRELPPVAFGDPPRLVTPRVGDEGVSLEVIASGHATNAWSAADLPVIRNGRWRAVVLPVLAAPGAGRISATVIERGPEGERALGAAIRPHLGRLRLRWVVPERVGAGDGTKVTRIARLGAPLDVEVPLGVEVAGPGLADRARARLSWHAASAADRARAGMREGVVAVAHRLPAPVRRILVDVRRVIRRRQA